MEASRWAVEEFGQAEFGDARLQRRIFDLAATAATRPAARITQLYESTAQRRGAYRALNHPKVTHQRLALAAVDAMLSRAAKHKIVFIPIDKSDFEHTDTKKEAGTGPIKKRRYKKRGFMMNNAIALNPQGIALGMADQRFWSRKETKSKKHHHLRATEDKETQAWMDSLESISLTFQKATTRPWVLIDAEGDAWPLLKKVVDDKMLATIRVARNRHLTAIDEDGKQRWLRDQLAEQPVAMHYQLAVRGRPKRRARLATMAVRFTKVELKLTPRGSSRSFAVKLTCVWAREVSEVPSGEKPLDWQLLTTARVRSATDACYILYTYSFRWRVEEFHRGWKSGGTQLQTSQLRSEDALLNLAVILASVAMRAMALRDESRANPQQVATVALSEVELDALYVLWKKRKRRRKEMPTLQQAVEWIARLGGYTGKSSGGPPGIQVINRGLSRLEVGVQMLNTLSQPTEKVEKERSDQ
mgnify:CR=1 FL=1